ncbi:RagB/SusD family nutrient uptake outer membrane protein [Hymenobacter norwichensis]|uniref:RagB/SusD family nutrient uptake outer membrane protein n=1 Tax=Hymenobacter norwichensis TaxID=223903 RepID=UPI0003B2EB0F|nr:RagB/SusD family nutrient uptake outer membrane protein [Hymenobacter norwichensis]
MKHNLRISALAIGLAWATTACERVETEPRDYIREDLVWDEKDRNATLAIFFLNDVYNYIPGGFNRIGSGNGDFLDAGAGDAVPSRINRPVEFYTNGSVSSINNPDPYWANSYAGVRRVNIFLANIDKVPTTAINLQYWKAEVRFIRAMLWFELLKRYGGVPLIGDRILTVDDDLELPRNTYAEVLDYIVSECDAIKGLLRVEPIADSDWGRIPRGAAMALKARVLLYAASPLYNGGATNGSPLNGLPTADATRWQSVVAACEELRALNYYALQSSFNNVFTVKKNTEIILAKQSGNSTNIESLNAPIGYGAPTASQGLTSPTQNLVDAFPTLTGRSITETGTDYNAATPYANRDPRLALTVFANGSRWLNRSVETFDGGRDRPAGSAVQTRTGYYLRKFMADFSNNTTYTNQSHNFPLFRYAETLLTYAEALNEVGRTENAVTQLIDLRRRAGITAGTNSRYGIKAGITQAEARELIRNERRIELAFEEHRFWDVRRWKIGETALNGPLFGVQIVRNGTALTYNRQQVSTMTFRSNLYYMPIPYDETTKNRNLTQNPGW